MNDIDALIRQIVDDSIDRAQGKGRRARAALMRSRRRRVLTRVAAAGVVASVLIVFVAWSPWSASDRARTSRVVPSIETASAKVVLRRVADRMVDEGTGRWLYIRTSTWSLDHRRFSGVSCARKCVYYGTGTEGTRVPINITTVPFVRYGMTEWWSDGERNLARRQYSSENAGTRACLKPSSAVRCLGWEQRMLDQIDPPRPFPADPAQGRIVLEQLARQRNDATRKAMSTDRFPTRGAALTAGEIGMRLLTGPVYDAQNRARVIRALGELPGATNQGATTDAMGREGIEIHLPAQRVAFPRSPGQRMRQRPAAGSPVNRSERQRRTIIAVFDVANGLLLQYHLSNEWTSPVQEHEPWSYVVVDAQERQVSPTPTDDIVEQLTSSASPEISSSP